MFSRVFWKDTAERAISTGAQAVLLNLGSTQGLNLFETTPANLAGFFFGGALLSVLKSLIASRKGDKDSASFL